MKLSKKIQQIIINIDILANAFEMCKSEYEPMGDASKDYVLGKFNDISYRLDVIIKDMENLVGEIKNDYQ